MADLGNNPDAMAAIVSAFGATPVPARTFQFDIPLGKAKESINKIEQLTGLTADLKYERTEQCSDGIDRIQTVARYELKRQPEKSEYDQQRSLMSVCIR